MASEAKSFHAVLPCYVSLDPQVMLIHCGDRWLCRFHLSWKESGVSSAGDFLWACLQILSYHSDCWSSSDLVLSGMWCLALFWMVPFHKERPSCQDRSGLHWETLLEDILKTKLVHVSGFLDLGRLREARALPVTMGRSSLWLNSLPKGAQWTCLYKTDLAIYGALKEFTGKMEQLFWSLLF